MWGINNAVTEKKCVNKEQLWSKQRSKSFWNHRESDTNRGIYYFFCILVQKKNFSAPSSNRKKQDFIYEGDWVPTAGKFEVDGCFSGNFEASGLKCKERNQKKLFLDFKSIFVKFLIENLMKDMKHSVREKHVFDYEINPYWYQFLELLDHQKSDAMIKINVFQPKPYLELLFFTMKFWKQTSM